MRHFRWLILLLLLFTFALRVFGIDAVRHDFDRAYAHGAGIQIVENIATGRWQALPLLSLRTNIHLPNPAFASYLWAAIVVFPSARDPYVITFVNIALNVLALAMLADLGRRLFGKKTALLALLFAASSLWSVYLAQGAWLQGLLEFSSITTLWLMTRAIISRKPQFVFVALCVVALLMQSYLVAFGLLAQVLVIGLIIRRRFLTSPAIRHAYLAGLGVCFIGIALYIGLVYSDPPRFFDLRSGVNNASNSTSSVPNPFGISNTFAAFYHAIGVITGRFYEAMWANSPDTGFALRDTLSNTRAIFIELLFGLGVLLAVWQRRFRNLAALAWFGLPVIGVTALSVLLPNLAVFHHYMMITAPGGYLLAGAAAEDLLNWLKPIGQRWQKAVMVMVVVFLLSIPAANFVVHVGINRTQPFDGKDLETLTIQQLLAVAQSWRNGCDEIANPQHLNWVASVAGSSQRIRAASFTRVQLPNNGSAESWHILANGTSCLTRSTQPIPNYITFSQPIGNIGLSTYRYQYSQLLHASNPDCDNTPLAINLGWSQLQLCSPTQASAGQVINVRFVWEIGGLPPSHTDYQKWRYEPFIKLINPQGQVVLSAEGAGVLGDAWRAGDRIVSEVNVDLPANLPAGAYRLELSLFDRGQGRNAWWLKPDQLNGPPINSLSRDLLVK